MSATLVFLIAYAILMVGVGLWVGRLVRSGGDFFVANRDLSGGLVFSTFLAANIGAGATVGATSLAYREGLSAWWWNGSAAIGSLVLAFWVGPRIWREAKARGYLTLGDFLERRYGAGVSRLVAALIWLGTLSILAAQLIGAAAVLSVAGGIPRSAGVIIAAVVTTAYFAAGGLLSSARVNALQVAIILLGFSIAVPIVTAHAGGWPGLTLNAGTRADFWFSSGSGSGWTLLVLLGPAFIVSPGLLQKAYGARNERALRRGVAANAVALMIFGFFPVLLGLAAYHAFPNLANADEALPAVLTARLPPAVSALALAAIFSAAISSADAVLFMLATSASRDLYRGLVNPAASEAQILRVARWASAAGGVLGIGLAFVYQSVVAALTTFYALLTVTLFVPVLGGLLVGRAGRAEAYGAIAAGLVTQVAVQALTGGRGFGLWTPTLCALLAAGLVFAGSTLSRGGPANRA